MDFDKDGKITFEEDWLPLNQYDIGIIGWFEYLNKNEPSLHDQLTTPQSAYAKSTLLKSKKKLRKMQKYIDKSERLNKTQRQREERYKQELEEKQKKEAS